MRPPYQNIVDGCHAVHLSEELIDHVVVDDGGSDAAGTPRLHDGVDLVEDDDVELALLTFAFVLLLRRREELAV